MSVGTRAWAAACAIGLATNVCGGDGTGLGTLAYIRVAPDSTFVFATLQRQFGAFGVQTDSDSVAVSPTFTATGGSITASGVFTAGGTPGNYVVVASAAGFVDTAKVEVRALPPPGSYTPVAGDDWLSYGTTQDLIDAGIFGQPRSDPQFTVAANIAIVADQFFSQVARITQPKDTSTTANAGWTPLSVRVLPAPIDQAWYRFRVRCSPGWTTVGPYPSGAANSYKLAFILWQGYSERAEIEFSNTNQYIIGFSFQGVSCSSSLMTGSMSFGNASAEWTNGDWWEFIMYYQKTGATSARHRWWRRQLTSGATLQNNSFTFRGEEVTSCSSATPQARAINLGANKNKTTPADQYIYWGPWEVVDGSAYPNPWGVGP